MSEVLTDLGAPEFATRESATDELRKSGLALAEIERFLQQPDLTPEQRARVSLVARERFAETPRAAMGVSFAQGGLGGADMGPLGISDVFVNFPSHGILQKGDELIAVDGRVVRGLSASRGRGLSCVRPYIICFDPGDTVKMTVLRGGEQMTLDVPLGDFANLMRNPGGQEQLDQIDIDAAWKLRISSRGAGSEKPIEGPALPALPDSAVSGLEQEEARRLQFFEPLGAGVVEGGASRDIELFPMAGATQSARFGGLLTERRNLDRLKQLGPQLAMLNGQIMEQSRLIQKLEGSPAQRQAAMDRQRELIAARDQLQDEYSKRVIELEVNQQIRGGNQRILRP